MYFPGYFQTEIGKRLPPRSQTEGKYKRVPLHRKFGGYMPACVRAASFYAAIGNRNRLIKRKA